MRIGFISDAHGNPFGLKLCLDLLRQAKADRIYFLGDAVGYFPDVLEVLDLLRMNGVCCLMGNHEAMLLGQLPLDPEKEAICRIEDARRKMSASLIREVFAWDRKKFVGINGRQIALMHGNPKAPLDGYLYPDSDIEFLSEIDADLIVMGHTHRPFIRHSQNLWVLNIGSTSLPRQENARAVCGLYDTNTDRAHLLYAPLPVEALVVHYSGKVHERVLMTLTR